MNHKKLAVGVAMVFTAVYLLYFMIIYPSISNEVTVFEFAFTLLGQMAVILIIFFLLLMGIGTIGRALDGDQ